MRVTYIGHSGFLVETEEVYLLFDCIAADEDEQESGLLEYSTGKLPQLNAEKELVVFVSHRHEDHYSHAIWKLKNRYPHVKYVISRDIPFSPRVRERRGIVEADLSNILRVFADEENELSLRNGSVLKIETFLSTDIGVAYYVTVNGHTIYHAGDLNLWLWEEESEEFNRDMSKRFRKVLEQLRGRKTDVAFLPLDPRQGEDAYKGMDAYLSAMDVKYAFPMHFWKQYDMITAYKEARKDKEYVSAVQNMEREGQIFEL